MQLRVFQQEIENSIYHGWGTTPNQLAVLPTGGGKTAVFSSILAKEQGPALAMAHRSELISQMSCSLAKWGLRHHIVAPSTTVREITKLHFGKFGQSFVDRSSPLVCSSVDTLIRRDYDWFNRVGLWVVDEAHHVLRENKWGKAVELFPRARGLGVTATPLRADGKGLGRHADGVFDNMVVGPTGRDLMEEGWLCEYDVYSFPPGDIDWNSVEKGSTGDYKNPQLRKVTHSSRQLVGDVVGTYLAYAKGKRGITFAVDVRQAREITERYLAAGVPAELIVDKTPATRRSAVLSAFERGETLQLVNVDLFGEGLDVSGVEVVSMARKTASLALFMQQLGRALRPEFTPGTDMSTAAGRVAGMAKRAIILDHVGNFIEHAMRFGLPEDPKPWTLDAKEKRRSSKEQGVSLTACTSCGKPYESFRPACPYCGHEVAPTQRSRPEQVEGDLELLDKNALRALAREIERIDGEPTPPANMDRVALGGYHKRHKVRQQEQQALRQTMAQWGGWRKQEGLTDREIQRLFYQTFGVDVLSAQALGAPDAIALRQKIEEQI